MKLVKLGRSMIYNNIIIIVVVLWNTKLLELELVVEVENEVWNELSPTMKLVRLGRSE